LGNYWGSGGIPTSTLLPHQNDNARYTRFTTRKIITES
jgi:hypothetical protein